MRRPPRTQAGEHHDEGEAQAARARERADRQDEERDDDVELLLDGQRPGVTQRRRVTDLVEVAVAPADQPPVEVEAQGGECVAAELLLLGGLLEEGGVRQNCGDEDEHRRQHAPRATHVETAHVDATGALTFLDEDARDEEAGEHEEVVDAHPAADEARRAEVIRDDEQDEQAAVASPRSSGSPRARSGCRRRRG